MWPSSVLCHRKWHYARTNTEKLEMTNYFFPSPENEFVYGNRECGRLLYFRDARQQLKLRRPFKTDQEKKHLGIWKSTSFIIDSLEWDVKFHNLCASMFGRARSEAMSSSDFWVKIRWWCRLFCRNAAIAVILNLFWKVAITAFFVSMHFWQDLSVSPYANWISAPNIFLIFCTEIVQPYAAVQIDSATKKPNYEGKKGSPYCKCWWQDR